jgi:hypothetical protein
MKKISILLILLIVLAAAAGAQEGRYGSGEREILIAFEPTRFKKELISGLLEELDDGGFSILVVNHQKKGLEGLKAADFDVVFISNSGATAKVRPDVSRWVAANGHPDNVIVHTTQRTQWTPKLEVDSVTSASLRKKDEIADLVREFAGRIRSRLP